MKKLSEIVINSLLLVKIMKFLNLKYIIKLLYFNLKVQ
jgi:hypothetical protein